ncbi:MAG TPA: TonB family protein [Gammaproteobacteria bacterium]|nr:TonB family protein [Gammaproteobacteria bacterium]
MILTMAYLFVIALLMGLAALLGERLCAELGRPRRSAWLIALVASASLPVYAMFVDANTPAGSPILSLPMLDILPTIRGVGTDTVVAAAPGATPFGWPDWKAFDSAIVAVWAGSSTAMLTLCLIAGWRLHRVLSRSQPVTIEDQEVLVSDRLGPAVLGFLRPRIVLPRWLAEQGTALRSLVLNHEREHIAARDHIALLGALALIALMPWNVALWWQLRRLRTAMEIDCDSRVLRDGANARAYSEALLTVGRQSVRTPFGSVALTEPVSELERRIRIMMDKARSFSLAGFSARSVLALSVLGLALAVNAPNAQQPAEGNGAAISQKNFPTIRTAIYDRLSEAQACIEAEDTSCAIRVLDEVADIRDLNAYESAQLYNFYAFAHFNRDDTEEAARAYENILALPRSDIPDGMIQSTMRSLSMLYIQTGRFDDGLDLFDRWMALPIVTPKPSDYYLKATILYQLERYQDALAPLEHAIAEAEEPTESYYQLLYALQYVTDDHDAMLSTLQTLNARWPKEEWTDALAGAERLQQGAVEELVASVTSDSTQQLQQDQEAPLSDEYLPVVTVAPMYPPRAAQRGLEGYVVLSYTVNATGRTENIEVVESSSTEFEEASIESVEKYRYRPRIVDGATIPVDGVTTRVVFELE